MQKSHANAWLLVFAQQNNFTLRPNPLHNKPMAGGENILTIKQLMEDEPLNDAFTRHKEMIYQELKTLIDIEHQNTRFVSGDRVYTVTPEQEKIAQKAKARKWDILLEHRETKSFAMQDLTYQEFRRLYANMTPDDSKLAQDIAKATRLALKSLKEEK